uniref:Uncharacterized protein n=1 Tax=Brassica campestris TaxID=3711 RepID=M4ECQ8_BRACM
MGGRLAGGFGGNTRHSLSSLSLEDDFLRSDSPGARTARDGAYRRPEGPPSISLLVLLPPLHQSSYLRYVRSRGLGFDASECSAAEALLLWWSLRLSVASASGLRGSAWLLRVNVGSPLQVQGVARLGIEFLGSRCFVSSGSLSIGVVCAGGSFYHGGGLMVVYAVSVAVCSSSSPRTSSSRFMICFPGLILSEVGTSCSVVEFSGFRLGISLVLHFMLAGASDGFSSSSFSSSVLDGYGRVMVLVSLTRRYRRAVLRIFGF